MKHLVCVALIAAFAGLAHADVKPPPPTPTAPVASAPQNDVRPALFVVRDADSAIYLFGTLHVRRPGDAWGGPEARAALAQADEVWTEMDMSEVNQAEVQALVMSQGIAPEDRPLSSWLNKAEREQLAAALARYGGSPAAFERMRPWLAAMTLTVLPMQQAGYQASAGADQAVVNASGAARQRTFETAAQQIGFFANLSDVAQREYLMDTINTAAEGETAIDAVSSAWETGDLDAIEVNVLNSFRDRYPELFQVIFVQRNRVWTETLVHELDGAGVDFVAVGAGHLLGDEGVVALLRARGLTVERVE